MLGDERTRHLYGLLVDLAVVALVGVALTTTWWVLLALVAAAPATARALTLVARRQGHRPDLVPVLQLTGVAELLYAAGHASPGIAVSVLGSSRRSGARRPPR